MSERISAAAFVACVVGKDGIPKDDKPVVALVGRSNVGKSSLINAVVGRRDMAKTSSTPGKTLTINYYLINDSFYLVDLPGYGYAKASRVTKNRIQTMMNEFFEECVNLKGIVQVMDLRHSPTSLDRQTFAWLKDLGINYMSVLTKCDKLGQQQANSMKREYLKELEISSTLLFSSKTGQGKIPFTDALMQLISGEVAAVDVQAGRPGRRRQSQQQQSQQQQSQQQQRRAHAGQTAGKGGEAKHDRPNDRSRPDHARSGKGEHAQKPEATGQPKRKPRRLQNRPNLGNGTQPAQSTAPARTSGAGPALAPAPNLPAVTPSDPVNVPSGTTSSVVPTRENVASDKAQNHGKSSERSHKNPRYGRRHRGPGACKPGSAPDNSKPEGGQP